MRVPKRKRQKTCGRHSSKCYLMLTFCNCYVLWLLCCVQLRLVTVTLSDVNVVWCYFLSQYRLALYCINHSILSGSDSLFGCNMSGRLVNFAIAWSCCRIYASFSDNIQLRIDLIQIECKERWRQNLSQLFKVLKVVGNEKWGGSGVWLLFE